MREPGIHRGVGEMDSGFARRGAPRNDRNNSCIALLDRVPASPRYAVAMGPRLRGDDIGGVEGLAPLFLFKFQTATRHRPCCYDGAGAPEALVRSSITMRARGTPDARAHPQPRVQKVKSTRASSPRSRRLHPAFRTRWGSGLLRALPGGRCYVTASLLRVSASGWKRLSAGLTPASGVGTTRLGPARTAWFVCRRLHRSHASGCCARPCGCVRAIRACAPRPSLRPDAAAPPHPAPRIVTIAKRPS